MGAKWDDKGISMNVKPLQTKAEYKAALKIVFALVDADPRRGTPEVEQLETLGALLLAYEAKHFPIDLPDPVEAIKFRMEQQGLKPKDLQPMIGGLNRVYEMPNRKRPPTVRVVTRPLFNFSPLTRPASEIEGE
jgi:HTH-type transcriptional regulator / antitoxin HigA